MGQNWPASLPGEKRDVRRISFRILRLVFDSVCRRRACRGSRVRDGECLYGKPSVLRSRDVQARMPWRRTSCSRPRRCTRPPRRPHRRLRPGTHARRGRTQAAAAQRAHGALPGTVARRPSIGDVFPREALRRSRHVQNRNGFSGSLLNNTLPSPELDIVETRPRRESRNETQIISGARAFHPRAVAGAGADPCVPRARQMALGRLRTHRGGPWRVIIKRSLT